MIYRDDIQKVYDLLAAPERWTQGEHAKDADGNRCNWGDSAARSWCLAGAWLYVTPASLDYFELRKALFGNDATPIVDFNDAPGRTHAEVLALLRSAMERAPVRPVQPDGGVGT